MRPLLHAGAAAVAAKQRRHLGQLREHPYQRAGALSWRALCHLARLVSISVTFYYYIYYVLALLIIIIIIHIHCFVVFIYYYYYYLLFRITDKLYCEYWRLYTSTHIYTYQCSILLIHIRNASQHWITSSNSKYVIRLQSLTITT